MGTFGIDEEVPEKIETEKVVELKQKPRAFAYWAVGGEDYKLKLTTADICQLEEKWGRGLFNVMMAGDIPALGVMLTVVQTAVKRWNHGIKFSQVQTMFDQYVEEGGSLLSLFTDVVMPTLSVSGFFTQSQREDLDARIEVMREDL